MIQKIALFILINIVFISCNPKTQLKTQVIDSLANENHIEFFIGTINIWNNNISLDIPVSVLSFDTIIQIPYGVYNFQTINYLNEKLAGTLNVQENNLLYIDITTTNWKKDSSGIFNNINKMIPYFFYTKSLGCFHDLKSELFWYTNGYICYKKKLIKNTADIKNLFSMFENS